MEAGPAKAVQAAVMGAMVQGMLIGAGVQKQPARPEVHRGRGGQGSPGREQSSVEAARVSGGPGAAGGQGMMGAELGHIWGQGGAEKSAPVAPSPPSRKDMSYNRVPSDKRVPAMFLCPVTLEIMKEPVVCSDG